MQAISVCPIGEFETDVESDQGSDKEQLDTDVIAKYGEWQWMTRLSTSILIHNI